MRSMGFFFELVSWLGFTVITCCYGGSTQVQPQDVDASCVDILKQPAFDHPSLQNHKIQMQPSWFSNKPKRMMINSASSSSMTHADLEFKSCPPGTVPILQTRKESNHLLEPDPLSYQSTGEDFAILGTMEPATYFGAKATMNLCNPQVTLDQYSMAQIWVVSGDSANDINYIQAGWAVNPTLYKDNRTRLTAKWMVGGTTVSGCENTLCPGFVQVHNKYFLGAGFTNMSTFGGTQYVTTILILQDAESKHWWLTVNYELAIGYWPKEIFNKMEKGAGWIRYGGKTRVSDGLTPEMGNGKWPNDKPQESAYFSNLAIVNAGHVLDADMSYIKLGELVSSTSCYGLKFWGYRPEMRMAYSFSYGGPGGVCA